MYIYICTCARMIVGICNCPQFFGSCRTPPVVASTLLQTKVWELRTSNPFVLGLEHVGMFRYNIITMGCNLSWDWNIEIFWDVSLQIKCSWNVTKLVRISCCKETDQKEAAGVGDRVLCNGRPGMIFGKPASGAERQMLHVMNMWFHLPPK